MRKKLKIYISHSIMGKWGKEATSEQVAKNCGKAIEFGKWLRKNFSGIEFYIPAEHEEFVNRCYQKNYLTIEQILEIDCAIISKCDGVLIYSPDNFISKGMTIEKDFANLIPLPIFILNSVDVWTDLLTPHTNGKTRIKSWLLLLENEK